MIWQNSQLEEALGCQPIITNESSSSIGKVQFNSKDIEPGDIFIALKSENGSDGHQYTQDALERGAALAIIEQDIEGIAPSKTTKVPNTYEALLKLAEYKRRTSKAKFVGITGSSGKTSTKESTKIILEAFGKTFASRGNFNNYLGVPINLASMPDDIDYAVIEMGMNHSGEISKLAKLVKPDLAVITNVGPAHLQFFNSVEEIADAKSEIFEGLNEDGRAIINRDSPYFARIYSNASSLNVQNIRTFGTNLECDSQLKKYEFLSDTGVLLEYIVFDKVISITRSLLPKHFAQNIAASLLVAACFENDIEIALPQIRKIEVPKGRGDIIHINRLGIKNTIVCDHYNANPESVKAALKYFGGIAHPNKMIILGDMRELGEASQQLHEELAPFIIESGALKVLLIGEYSASIADKLPSSVQVRTFRHVDHLIAELDQLINDGKLILIKGSKSMNLSKIVDILKGNLSAL